MTTTHKPGPGRPKGCKTTVSVKKSTARKALLAISKRADDGDLEAQALIVQLVTSQPWLVEGLPVPQSGRDAA